MSFNFRKPLRHIATSGAVADHMTRLGRRRQEAFTPEKFRQGPGLADTSAADLGAYIADNYGLCLTEPCRCRNDGWQGRACPSWVPVRAKTWEPPVLCAYGRDDMDILAACNIDGQFVPLRIPRSVLVSIFEPNKLGGKLDTWAQMLKQFFVTRDGPVPLDELYRYFADHKKAANNPNFKAKLRYYGANATGRHE